jgi:hypothetical protein
MQHIDKMCTWFCQVPVHAVQLDMRDLEAVKRLAEELPSEFREVGAGCALQLHITLPSPFVNCCSCCLGGTPIIAAVPS